MRTPAKTSSDGDKSAPEWEILTEAPNGHRTVHRVRAKTRAAAIDTAVEAGVDRDQILEAERSPSGLGSG